MKILDTIKKASAHYNKLVQVDCRSMGRDQWAAQGDVQIHRLASKPDDVGDPWPTQQVVPGNTKGSRHVFDERVKLYSRKNPESDLVGPYAFVEDEGTLLHPEHRNALLGRDWYAITYQRDFRWEELRRQKD